MWRSIALVALLMTTAICLFAPGAKAQYAASEWDRIARLEQETSGEWSIGAGAAIMHSSGLMLDLKYTRQFGKAPWFRWYSTLAVFNGQPAVSAGLHLDLEWFYMGVGVGLTEANDIVSTTWSYEWPIVGIWITPNVAIEYSHRSNCSSAASYTGDRCLWVLPRGTTPNWGYNFLTLRRRF